jgi:hypothetical protein
MKMQKKKGKARQTQIIATETSLNQFKNLINTWNGSS